MYITASKLYDYTQCPHRVWRDAWGPKDEKIKEINSFVQLLWDKGIYHEDKIIKKIGKFLDLRKGNLNERFEATISAMKAKTPLIYQGVLRHGELLGIPDLIRLQSDGTYIPIEIKSGMGLEGGDDETGEEGKPKKHYAVQLGLYVDLLEQLGFEHKNKGIVIDLHGNEVEYNMDKLLGVRSKQTIWQVYEQIKNNVQLLLKNEAQNKPAYSGKCKLCSWYHSCKKWVKESNDLSGLFDIGSSKRDKINEDLLIYKIEDLEEIDIEKILEKRKKDNTFLKGMAENTLSKIKRRAIVLKNNKPVIYEKLNLPEVDFELFFDIEGDPTQEFIYLHGVYERSPKGERYIEFTARENSQEAEKKAWQGFWEYINKLPKDNFAVYYYSHYEKTTYKKLQKQYPDIITEKEVSEFFVSTYVVDLYTDIVKKHTDWPLPSYSIKDIATYLGFKWRDETPSGALSIEWFNKYLETGDEKIMQRLFEYNEDDCRATMVLKDYLVKS